MQNELLETSERESPRGSVFIATTNIQGRRSLKALLARLGYESAEFFSAATLLQDLHQHPTPVAVVFELGPELENDLESLAGLASGITPVPVIVISSHHEPETIVRAGRLGAASFLPRPFTTRNVRKSIATAIETGRPKEGPSNPLKSSMRDNPRSFVCASPRMRSLEELARRVADSDITVLIQGESGSGKEVIARYVHSCSTRAKGPFVKVNCAALPEELLESELFGYDKGAFTGATTAKLGKFEAANGGTIFLDEITETSIRLQAKLLHVLQDKQFTHLGGNQTIDVDVRVVAATNADLERELEEGRFREDLYFRLKIIELCVPPLRERRGEIPLLIDHFRHYFAAQYRRPVPTLSEKLLNLMVNYRWTGNVRELENIMKRIVILGDEPAVIQELLSKSDFSASATSSRARVVAPDAKETPRPSLKEVGERAATAAERTLIESTLEQTRWNRMRASRMLGVSYKTLLTKMKKCGLSEA